MCAYALPRNQEPLSLVVSGTGTDVGKTIVTAALLRALLEQKVRAKAIKLIQTGVTEATDGDAQIYRNSCHDLANYTESDVLHAFRLPASPHLAAGAENALLTVRDLVQEVNKLCHDARGHFDVLLFETAGGLSVPLNAEEDMLDLLSCLGFPVLLVVQNVLGALNHAQLSIAALKEADLPLTALLLNETSQADSPLERSIRDDNVDLLRKRLNMRLPETQLFQLPYNPTHEITPLSTLLSPLVRSLKENATNALQEAIPPAEEIVTRDRAHLWHPYAKARSTSPLYAVAETYKNRILLTDGRELIDGMSSWWSAVHGYRHPHLLKALKAQASAFPHIMFGGLTHEVGVRLAERLIHHLPSPLSRVFFADSGSVAVEVAMKMAIQYQVAKNDNQRTRFLTIMGGYHGDTMGAMSVCDPVNGMHHLFSGLLTQQYFLDRPGTRFDGTFDPLALSQAESFLDEHGHEIAALILEPIVQGAGGMWFYHPDYLNKLVELCRQHGCLVIFDEIATGFGHTGKFFALEWTRVTPDIICMGKALTGGMLTLAATVCTDEVADGISRSGHVFMHGPTFMANPLAVSVAHASLDLMEEHLWPQQVAGIEDTLKKELASCRDLPNVADVRVLGDIGVVETREAVNADFLTSFAVEHGVWIRPFNHLVYVMPPYISPQDDVTTLCQVMREALCAQWQAFQY